MAANDPIEAWLGELRQRLRYDPLLLARVSGEVAQHLTDAASDEERSGASAPEARRRAVERFGRPEEFASALPRHEVTLRLASLGGGAGSFGIGVFLMVAVVWLIPPGESSTRPVFAAAAVGALLYGALTWLYFRASMRALMPALMGLSSIAAVGVAAVAVGQGVYAALRAGDWEFYVLVCGLVVATHALTVIVYLYCWKKRWSSAPFAAFHR